MLAHLLGEGNAYDLSFTTWNDQFLIGTQQVAWLHFSTVSNQTSAFVTLALDNITGTQPDGTIVRNFAPQSGRLVIIGEEPLLEAGFDTNRQPILALYGKPGPGYILETSTWLDGPWPTNQSLSLPDLWLNLSVPAPPFQQYFRAKRITP